MGDAPMRPELLKQIPADEPITSVSGDGAYDTQLCHAAIAARGAQAIIPLRRNAQFWKPGHAGAAARNEALRACQYLGRRLWKRWSGYHCRSLVETKMHCFKRLGDRVAARTFERQARRVADPCCVAQPLQPARPAEYGHRGSDGINPSGVWGSFAPS
ncbi:protein of unknown function [Burkholderia multivorans]